MKQKERIWVRVKPSLKRAAEKAARDEQRTLSDWIRLLIQSAVSPEK